MSHTKKTYVSIPGEHLRHPRIPIERHNVDERQADGNLRTVVAERRRVSPRHGTHAPKVIKQALVVRRRELGGRVNGLTSAL